jgi:hypothetical protein
MYIFCHNVMIEYNWYPRRYVNIKLLGNQNTGITKRSVGWSQHIFSKLDPGLLKQSQEEHILSRVRCEDLQRICSLSNQYHVLCVQGSCQGGKEGVGEGMIKTLELKQQKIILLCTRKKWTINWIILYTCC